MSIYLRKNFSKAELSANLSELAVQLVVKPGHTLPTTAGQFPLVIWNFDVISDPSDAPDLEIVIASYSGVPNVYNIVRGQESTIPSEHNEGDRVALHYTAKMSEEDLEYVPSYVDDHISDASIHREMNYDDVLGSYLIVN